MSILIALLAAAATPVPCALPTGWEAVAARKTRYVVFGELHGTEQAPALFGTVACALARKGERVLVAIEISSDQNTALQAAWRQPHDLFASAMLRDVSDWTRQRDGGLATKSMLAMLVRLHSAKAAGAKIDVVAFNGARDDTQRQRFAALPGQGPHEAAQAENIRTAATAGRYDRVLVLVGNLHARKQPIERGGVSFEPMAMQLAPANQVTSLNIVYASGTAWNCQLRAGVVLTPGQPVGRTDIECASRPERGVDATPGGPQLGIGARPPTVSQGVYDGWFWVGPVTASPPAVDAPPPKP